MKHKMKRRKRSRRTVEKEGWQKEEEEELSVRPGAGGYSDPKPS